MHDMNPSTQNKPLVAIIGIFLLAFAVALIFNVAGFRDAFLTAVKIPPSNTLTLSSVTSRTVTIQWTLADQRGKGITGFAIERSTVSGLFAGIATTTSTATQYVDSSGLVPDSNYSYRIRAFTTKGANVSYLSYSNILAVQTLA